MSKLNNFWDDCIEDDFSELNMFTKSKEQIHSSSNTNRTKLSTSTTNSHNVFKPIISSKKPHLLLSKIKNYKNINDYKTNNSQRSISSRYSTLKNDKRTLDNNKKYKTIINNDYYSRNKTKINNNSCISSSEQKLRKDLSECTFNPKLISNIKNKNLKEKLYNYSRFTMYERGQIFEMKKKEDNERIFYQEYKKRNIKYPFKPKINKCPSFKNVIFNDSNYDSLNYFYSRMNSAREYKIYKNKKMPFEIINYDEIYKNDNNFIIDNNLSLIYGNKIKKKKKVNRLSPSLLMTRILSDKETELCKQNLHNALMNLQLNKNEYK